MNIFKINNYEYITENPLYINTPKFRLLRDFIIDYLLMQLLICFSFNVFCYVTIPFILARLYAQIDYIKAWKASSFSKRFLCILYLVKCAALIIVGAVLRFYVIDRLLF